jgi:hypothetical protein
MHRTWRHAWSWVGAMTLVEVATMPRAVACWDDAECAPSQVCDRDDCEGGTPRPAGDTCTGRCVAGGTLRLVGRGGVFAPAGEGAAATVGVELLPPLLDHHLALAADWLSSGRGRCGVVVGGETHQVGIGVRADVLVGGPETTAAAALRVDLRGLWLQEHARAFRYLSVYAEVGAATSGSGGDGFLGVGLAVWAPPLYRLPHHERP